jgi:hypothetical protein
MAAWPGTTELAQVLNVDDATDWQTTLDRVLAAAIRKVKSDVGLWDDNVDEPDASLAQAALRMAELMATRPDAQTGRFATSSITTSDATYLRLLSGHRRRFGLA